MNMPVLVEIHEEDGCGNVLTLKRGLTVERNGQRIHVPEGFESDGVSVPYVFRRLVSPCIHQCTIRAAIAHDWLYRSNLPGWSRRDADRMFRGVCIEDGLHPVRAWIAYVGLRLFGWSEWTEK